jgi:diacylglycerol kinase family enzyme
MIDFNHGVASPFSIGFKEGGVYMRLSTGWRIVAFVTISVYILLIVSMIRLVVSHLGLILAFIPTALLLSYALWLQFSGTRRRAKVGVALLVISVAAVVAEFGYYLRTKDDLWAEIAVLVLLFIYVTLTRVVRERYWREVRGENESSRKTAQFHKPFLIINPKSGNGRADKAHVDELAAKKGITVLFTKKGEDVQVVANHAVSKGADVLGISGGDGSLGAVAKVAIEQQLPMVVLPGGTRCHFARDIGLEPKRITDALAGFHGVERLVDIADINGRVFLNNASFGLYADIVDTPGYREHKMRVSQNILRAIVSGTKELYDLHFKHGSLRVRKAVQVFVGVNSYDTFDLFELGHREKLNGGMLQITAVTRLNDSTVSELLRAVSIDQLGKHEKLKDVFQWVGKSFRITNYSRKIVAGVDGEREEYSTPVTIRIRPQELRLYVPAEGLRGRPKNPYSLINVIRVGRGVFMGKTLDTV